MKIKKFNILNNIDESHYIVECPYCKHKIPKSLDLDWKYCPLCGNMVDGETFLVGYKDDFIFLLSSDEFKLYRDIILKSNLNQLVWLRDSSYLDKKAKAGRISVSGSKKDVYVLENPVYSEAVLPAINVLKCTIDNSEEFLNKFLRAEIGERVMLYYFPWIKADREIIIAEIPIAYREFDYRTNFYFYDSSGIREFLFKWVKDRSQIEN